jgi:hypothetical protein
LYDVGYSNQSDYRNNPDNYALDRYNILLGATYVGVTIRSGMEQLDGNGRIIVGIIIGIFCKYMVMLTKAFAYQKIIFITILTLPVRIGKVMIGKH